MNGPPPSHEYKLENFNQTGNNFTATTPLDGSSSYIPGLAGQTLPQVVVRLDGHTMDDAFYFTNCTLTSNSVSANAKSAALKVAFACQSMHLYTSTPTPSPTTRPLQEMRVQPILIGTPTPAPRP